MGALPQGVQIVTVDVVVVADQREVDLAAQVLFQQRQQAQRGEPGRARQREGDIAEPLVEGLAEWVEARQRLAGVADGGEQAGHDGAAVAFAAGRRVGSHSPDAAGAKEGAAHLLGHCSRGRAGDRGVILQQSIVDKPLAVPDHLLPLGLVGQRRRLAEGVGIQAIHGLQHFVAVELADCGVGHGWSPLRIGNVQMAAGKVYPFSAGGSMSWGAGAPMQTCTRPRASVRSASAYGAEKGVMVSAAWTMESTP